ncbi:hypothetical protein ISN45_Aa08g009090 [Arabidopsis thaliana x Arabidopsis arenosa]|uniref:Uncharacterized protein n=1 Tax=Arabidopsis thaliana x Arabidopsis arenosa TaxID=1240361 RepID=A0A8T1XPR1_9BRAS|nr:hypothetical protein ISN45_Aa08g009090 [Arabidopsis thaliana x Arabidopsis arenosa]
MEDLELPHRLIAAGEAPLGEKANVYNKMKTLRGIIDSLDEDEIKYLLLPSSPGSSKYGGASLSYNTVSSAPSALNNFYLAPVIRNKSLFV